MANAQPQPPQLSKKGYIGFLDILPFLISVILTWVWFAGTESGRTAVIGILLASNTFLYFIVLVLAKNLNILNLKLETTLRTISQKVSGIDFTVET